MGTAAVVVVGVARAGLLVVGVEGAALPLEGSRVARPGACASIGSEGVRVAPGAGAGLFCHLRAVQGWVRCLAVVILIACCAAVACRSRKRNDFFIQLNILCIRFYLYRTF